MFRFSHPTYLYFLLALPLLLALFLWQNHRRRKQLEHFGNPALLQQLMPDVSMARHWWHIMLQLLALAVTVFMLAGPQFGSKLEKVKRRSAELMIALDVSNSMLSQDILPSRLDKSKQTLSRLIDELVDDRIGLIVFAGTAYTQLPITADYASAKMFLNTISPNLVPVQGTSISAALQLAQRSFGPVSEAGRAVIVITDGEDHEANAVEMAKEMHSKGVTVHVVGMGSPQGGPIPMGRNNDFHKDKNGQVVITKLNEEMCRSIAAAGGGVYVRADNSNAALKVLVAELDKMTKAETETTIYTEYDEQFQALAWIVLLLLLVDLFILERKNAQWKNIKLF